MDRIFALSPVPTIVLDSDDSIAQISGSCIGSFLFANKGVSSEDVVGLHLREFLARHTKTSARQAAFGGRCGQGEQAGPLDILRRCGDTMAHTSAANLRVRQTSLHCGGSSNASGRRHFRLSLRKSRDYNCQTQKHGRPGGSFVHYQRILPHLG